MITGEEGQEDGNAFVEFLLVSALLGLLLAATTSMLSGASRMVQIVAVAHEQAAERGLGLEGCQVISFSNTSDAILRCLTPGRETTTSYLITRPAAQQGGAEGGD